MSTRIKDLFGYPKVIIECDSGGDMLAVADIAIEELHVRNSSDTISYILRNRDNPEPFWDKTLFRWVGLSDLEDPPIMFAFHHGAEQIYGPCHFITVEECISTLISQQLTVTEQEFSDAFCELIQGVANG